MSAPVIVPKDIAQQGEQQINSGVIQTVKKGVELLLQNNLYIEGTLTTAGAGQREVSNLLKKGLTALTNAPHETLGIAVGAKTQEIRKAYKKNALQYHPDKNPLTTPLFQVIHAAHDKLSDRELRAKEERMAAAAAASVPSKGPTRQSYGGQSSSNSTSSANNPNSNYSSAYTKPTYEQRRSTFDAKPSAQQQSSYYNREPQQSTQQQRQEYPQSSAYARYQEEEALRKQRYEDFLKEQQKKVESDKRAKEFAARAQAQAAAERAYYEKQQADARKAAADFKQAADIQAEIAAKREEVLRAAAAAAAAGQAYRAGEAQSGKYGTKPPAPSSVPPGPSVERDSYRQPPGPNLRSFNTSNAGAGPSNPSQQYSAYSTNAGGAGSSSSSSTAYSNAHNGGGYSPRYGDVPSTNNGTNSTGAAGGPGVGRTYKATSDGNVYPNADAAPNSARGSGSTSGNGKVPPINVTENKDAKDKNDKYKYKYVYPPGVNENKTASGYPNDGSNTARSETSTGAGSAAGSSSTKGSVPRPFGLKCTSVTTSVVELEWNTSATYRNMLSVELSWRYLGNAAKHSWESANKLISSGKCRKKNLVSGGQYEFKVRAVEELVGGMLGNRSDWSESIFVTLARESSKDLNAMREDRKVPSSVEVPVKPQPTPTPAAAAAAPASNSTGTSPTGVNAAPTKPATDKIPTSFQRFNPKSESPITTNPSAAGSSSTPTAVEEPKPHRTQVPPVGAANVPPPIHRFTTINETSPSAQATSTTAHVPSVPLSRVGSSTFGSEGKNVLNSSAREAWGKDSIKIPSTPDKPNPNNNVSGTNNSRTFQVKSAAIPSSNPGSTPASAAGGSANVTPASATAAGHGVPPSSSRSSTLPAEYDAEYEVDEDIDYEDSRSPSPEGTHIDDEEEECESPNEGEEVEEEEGADAAATPTQMNGEGGEVESENEESGESEGIAYPHNNHKKPADKMEKRLHHAKVSPSMHSDSTSPSNHHKTTASTPLNQKKHRQVDSDDDDDADPADSPVLRFKSVNPNLIPPHLRQPPVTSDNGVSAGKKEPSVKAAIEAEDDEEDHYSDEEEEEEEEEEDSFDTEEEQYFDLIAPSGAASSYKHPVRAEPFMKSKLSGYLLMGCTALAIADCGDWLKVKVHQPTKSASAAVSAGGAVWGWCLRAEVIDGKRHEYLHKTAANPSFASFGKSVAASSSSSSAAASTSAPMGGSMSKTTESQSTGALPSLAQQATAATAALKARLQQQQQKTEESNKSPVVNNSTSSTSSSGGKAMGGSSSTSKIASPVPTNHKNSSAGSGGKSAAVSKEKEPSYADRITPLHPTSHLFTPTAASVAASINHSGSAAHLKGGGKVSPPTAGSANEKQFHGHKVNHKSGSEGRKAPKTTPSKENVKESVSVSNATAASSPAASNVSAAKVQESIDAEKDKNHTVDVNAESAVPNPATDKLPNLADRKSNSIRLAPLDPKSGANRSTYNLQAPSHSSSSAAAAAGEGGKSASHANGNKGGESVVETWMELFDTSGHPYYYNEATGESSWDAPEWIEEKDPTSGHKYYVKASQGDALTSTWTKPKKFAKLVRQVEAS